MTKIDDIPRLLDEVEAIYDTSVGNLREALRRFVTDGSRPGPGDRADGIFAYPELRLRYDPVGLVVRR